MATFAERTGTLTATTTTATPTKATTAAAGADDRQMNGVMQTVQEKKVHKPVTLQGRLRVGLRVALRGRDSALKFQTGGHSFPWLVDAYNWERCLVLSCGHLNLLRSQSKMLRLGRVGGGCILTTLPSIIKHGHEDVLREMLFGEFTALMDDVVRTVQTSSVLLKDTLTEALKRHWHWYIDWMRERAFACRWSEEELSRFRYCCLAAAAEAGSELSIVQRFARDIVAAAQQPSAGSNRCKGSSGGNNNNAGSSCSNSNTRNESGDGGRSGVGSGKGSATGVIAGDATNQEGESGGAESSNSETIPMTTVVSQLKLELHEMEARELVRSLGIGGNVAAFEWLANTCSALHINRYSASGAARDAATHGHLDMVKYLHTRPDCANRFDTFAMDRAAAGGHLETVEWLHYHRSEGCSDVALRDAARFGHLDVVRFLHQRRGATCKGNTIEAAASDSKPKATAVVEYLIQHNLDQITTQACMQAALSHNIRPDLLAFLAKHGLEEMRLALVNLPTDPEASDHLTTAIEAAAAAEESKRQAAEQKRHQAIYSRENGRLKPHRFQAAASCPPATALDTK